MIRAINTSKLAIHKINATPLTPKCIRIKVSYAGVNRADLLQRSGRYPPPPDASEILGLECSGLVKEIGSKVNRFNVGDRVMALLSGGGYTEEVVVEDELCLPVPNCLSLEQGAAIPENWITAFQLTEIANGLTSSDSVLIHAAASGVGSSLIQLSKAAGCENIFAIVGSPVKAEFATALGATKTLNRHELSSDDMAGEIASITNGSGVNIIFDCVGASVFDFNLGVAALDARWLLFGTLGGGSVASVSLGPVLGKRLQINATTLRSRSFDYRVNLIKRFNEIVMPKIINGELKVQIDRIVNWTETEEALNLLQTNSNRGKIVLKIDDSDKNINK